MKAVALKPTTLKVEGEQVAVPKGAEVEVDPKELDVKLKLRHRVLISKTDLAAEQKAAKEAAQAALETPEGDEGGEGGEGGEQ
ncbi:MAG: hypothetical protein AAGI72_15505 [Pseudomonadota bacterium]